MSDSQDEVDTTEEPVKTSQVKQKRQLSEKQLDNLSKAREKAKVVLAAKKERTQKLRKEEKKLKHLKRIHRENKVAAEMKLMQIEQESSEPKKHKPEKLEKAEVEVKRKKKPKVVYYSSSSSSASSSDASSSSSSEEEIKYRRRVKVKHPKRQRMSPVSKPVQPPRPRRKATPPRSVQSENDDAMLEHQYQLNMRKMKREMIMNSVFPTG